MHPVRRRAISALAILTVLATLLGAQPGASRAGSPAAIDMNVTLSVFTCCGSLQGFNPQRFATEPR